MSRVGIAHRLGEKTYVCHATPPHRTKLILSNQFMFVILFMFVISTIPNIHASPRFMYMHRHGAITGSVVGLGNFHNVTCTLERAFGTHAMGSVSVTYGAMAGVKVLLRRTQHNNPLALEVNVGLVGEFGELCFLPSFFFFLLCLSFSSFPQCFVWLTVLLTDYFYRSRDSHF